MVGMIGRLRQQVQSVVDRSSRRAAWTSGEADGGVNYVWASEEALEE